MKYDKDLYKLILQNKKARERLFVNRTVAYVVKQKYPNTLGNIPLDKLESVVLEILKLNRQWRKIMQENEDLQGLDYGAKKKAEQEWLIKNGYESGHYQDVKTLNKIK